MEKYVTGDTPDSERADRIIGATYPLDPEFAEVETVNPAP